MGAGASNNSDKLHAAVKNGDLQEAGRLIKSKGVNINAREKGTGNTVLHFAAAKGQAEMVSLLMRETKIEPNVENEHNTTPLILASGNGHAEVVQMLVNDPLVDPNFLSSTGVSALHLATQKGREGAVKALLACPRLLPNLKNGGDSSPHARVTLDPAASGDSRPAHRVLRPAHQMTLTPRI
ncbi:hypothetical protein CYMTET_22165, partial [Cymbomonas tetramitiformis]